MKVCTVLQSSAELRSSAPSQRNRCFIDLRRKLCVDICLPRRDEWGQVERDGPPCMNTSELNPAHDLLPTPPLAHTCTCIFSHCKAFIGVRLHRGIFDREDA